MTWKLESDTDEEASRSSRPRGEHRCDWSRYALLFGCVSTAGTESLTILYELIDINDPVAGGLDLTSST